MYKSLVAVCLLIYLTGCAPLEEATQKDLREIPDKLWIDDFNAGVKPNMLRGDFGAWNKDPNDPTQSCKEEFDETEKIGEEGFSIKLTYDVDSPNPAYNGFWMKLENADFRPYSKICFSVKGNPEAKFTDKFKVELKNAKGEVGSVVITGITDRWQEKVILFRNFRGITDFSQMTEFVIVFEDMRANPKTGVINIDNIYVTK